MASARLVLPVTMTAAATTATVTPAAVLATAATTAAATTAAVPTTAATTAADTTAADTATAGTTALVTIRAQAEELHRRDHQLLHEQLLKQNWNLREAHGKSVNEMEELKRFQSSTFDTIARRRLVEDQDTILGRIGKIQELQNENHCIE